MTEPATRTDPPCSCKVGTVATECGLDGVHGTLERRWGQADGPSVRALTDSFNKRVLRAAFRTAGQLPLDGEIDNVYRLLSDDSTDTVERSRVRERLRQDGIGVDSVEDRFVSHQTMYRHLTACLDLIHDGGHRSDTERIEAWRDRLRALEARTDRVTVRAIEQLTRSETIDVAAADVTVDIRVACEACGGFYQLEELLDARGCGCRNRSD